MKGYEINTVSTSSIGVFEFTSNILYASDISIFPRLLLVSLSSFLAVNGVVEALLKLRATN